MNVDDVLSQPMSWSRESSLYFLKGYLGKIVLLKDTDTQMKLLGKLIEIEEIFSVNGSLLKLSFNQRDFLLLLRFYFMKAS